MGSVETCLEMALEYAKERFTFGRAIGSYQAVKHGLVEILRRGENAKSLLYYAGWAHESGPDEFALAARAARVGRGEALDYAARENIAVHGGIGATWEHDAPLFFRRAQLSRRLLGGAGAATDRVAGELLAARPRAPRRRRTRRPRRDRGRRLVEARSRSGRALLVARPLLVPARLAVAVPAREVRAAPRAGRGARARRGGGVAAGVVRVAALVHSRGYLDRVAGGSLSVREVRGLGLPWSPELVERGRRSVGGTLGAPQDALVGGFGMNLGGGTHHASRTPAAATACSTTSRSRTPSPGRGRSSSTATSTRATGPPSCSPRRVRLHALRPRRGELPLPPRDVRPRRRPPDRDGRRRVPLRVEAALATALTRFSPTLIVYLAGADPWEGDALGRLSLTKAGLRARDTLVLDFAERLGVPICVTLAGGYAPDVTDTVDINFATGVTSARARSTTAATGHSSAGRAPALQAGGRRFDPGWLRRAPRRGGR